MSKEHNSPRHPSPIGLAQAEPDGAPLERELGAFGGVEVRRHRFPPGQTEVFAGFGGHLVTLHLGGPTRGTFRQGDLAAEVTETEGNVMVVPAGVPAYQALLDASEAVNVLLDESLVGRLAEEAGGNGGRVEVLGSFEGRDPRVAGVMRAFLLELGSGGRAGGALHAEALAQELAVHLLRYHSSLGRGAMRRLARRETVGLSKKELGVAVDFVNDNLSHGFSLAEVAGAVGLSPHHFSRLFRLSTGLAPHRYAVRRRAEKAKALLLGGHPPGLAAVEAGFHDQSHMGRHFKRLFGTTPSMALRKGPETSKNVL